ncbi:hypothetical protein ACJIZ3_003119 [Penstemon smallii]|uniref:Leucine-rich repeat-containing N-terminal plant-type domain-containing protein n=1 Tax=Penstemon smallii TaxID=265156 RepID=A0ABD3UAB2_9LAMI
MFVLTPCGPSALMALKKVTTTIIFFDLITARLPIIHDSPCHKYLFLLLLFTIFISLSCLTSLAAARCHVDDETGLLDFKSGIKTDPSRMLSSWIKGTDCCKWFGITCSTSNRVTTLTLVGRPNNLTQSLSGTISPSLSKLMLMHSIFLQDLKNLEGPFPYFLLNLPNIQYVYIENNKLSGPIPINISKMVHLSSLSLEGNRFSGPIPSSIGELTQLTQLRLGLNLLTGTIPNSIQRLKNLTLLHLDHNQISGTIPEIFSGFSNLRTLNFGYNKLTGKIPSGISSLAPLLAFLELGHNFLSGPIPDFLGKFQTLDTLDLSWNNFSGIVPKTFANLTKIFNLDLSHNLLVDPFPEMNVKGIESLDLSYNKFHLGTIPRWVTTSTIIYSLKLAKCGIKMKLDDWKPTDTYFYDYIDLSENEITGSAVTLLNRTDYLVGFYASGNKLKFDLGKLRIVKSLKDLDLSKNLVVGNVPKGVTGLEKLNVSYNHLCGKIPSTKFEASVFVGNDCLCGSPLPNCKV